MPDVRTPAVAGHFYPRQADALRAELSNCLGPLAPATRHPLRPKLLIVPHAGYRYSGSTAGQAYGLLPPWREQIRRVVLLGPAHQAWLPGIAAPKARAFDTPLGRIEIDAEALNAIDDLPQVVRDDEPHLGEHSLEVQLPFLQSVLERFTLVPLVVGDAQPAQVAEVLERLWGGPETLIVISTDLSHELPYAQARAADGATMQRMLRFDAGLAPIEACGARPVNGALRAARAHGLQPRLLALCNSGDSFGDPRHVVGYGAMVFEEPAT